VSTSAFAHPASSINLRDGLIPREKWASISNAAKNKISGTREKKEKRLIQTVPCSRKNRATTGEKDGENFAEERNAESFRRILAREDEKIEGR